MEKSRKNIKLITARMEKGLSQKELADRVGVGNMWISTIENGRGLPNLHLAIRIARELDETVENLFGDDFHE